jgi:hypothetical protein
MHADAEKAEAERAGRQSPERAAPAPRAPAHIRGGGTSPSRTIAAASRGSIAGATGASSGANASAQFLQQVWLKGLWKRPVAS